jgi:hypothetical protein
MMKRWLVAAVSLFTVVGVTPAVATSTTYQEIWDDTQALTVQVPDDWNDINGSASPEGFQRVLASPNLQDSYNNYDTPRVALFAYNGNSAHEARTAAEQDAGGQCEYYGAATWSNRGYSGEFSVFRKLNSTGGEFLAIGADSGQGYVIGIGILTITDADRSAERRIQDTFDVVGEITG